MKLTHYPLVNLPIHGGQLRTMDVTMPARLARARRAALTLWCLDLDGRWWSFRLKLPREQPWSDVEISSQSMQELHRLCVAKEPRW